jgi:tetratricopeptide (TPR) repeat protein
LPQNHLAQGVLFYLRGQFEPAAEEFMVFRQNRPSDPEALDYLGITFRRLGRWEEALETLNRAVELGPLDPGLVRNLALCQLYLRNYEEAGIFFDRYAELASAEVGVVPARDRAWLRLVSQGDVAGADQILRQAVGQFGLEAVLADLVGLDFVDLWFDLPNWGFREDLRNGALSRTSSDFYLARATAEQAEGNPEGAQAYYDSARVVLEAQEQLTASDHARLGIAYAGIGRNADAVREAEEGVRLRPMSLDAHAGPWSLMGLARTLVMVGDYERAVAVLDTLMTKPSEWSRTWLRFQPFFEPLHDHPGFRALVEGSPSTERD